MRDLFRLHNGEQARVIKAYANSEERGEVARKNNRHNLAPHHYAARLLTDGLRKGWIHK
jgi:hypothetical protein